MAAKKTDDSEYKALRKALKDGTPERLYIFHGDERYLLEHCLGELRKMADANGLGGFNHKRFDGKNLKVEELIEAAEALPVFAERTLVEVHDYNMFKADEASRTRLTELFGDLPEYLCLVFVFDTVEYAPDRRLKATTALLKNAHVVEFPVQGKPELVKWIRAHYAAVGKKIQPEDAEYLSFITGGLMTSMLGEIEKTAAYSQGEYVTKADIDAVVTPVLEAVSYKLADAVAAGSFEEAARILDELLQMKEPPHKLIFGVSLKLRQLYAARLCLDAGEDSSDLMEISGIKYPFQAKNLMSAARNMTTEEARSAVSLCAEAAFEMNSGSEPGEALTMLLVKLASERKVRR